MSLLRSTADDLRKTHVAIIEDISTPINKALGDPMEPIYAGLAIRLAYYRRAKKLRNLATTEAFEELAIEGFTRFGKIRLPLP